MKEIIQNFWNKLQQYYNTDDGIIVHITSVNRDGVSLLVTDHGFDPSYTYLTWEELENLQ